MGQRNEDLGETEIEEIVSERCAQSLCCVRIFEIPWTIASQSPLSLIPRQKSWQENWSGLPFASPGSLPDPGLKLGSPALQSDSMSLFKGSFLISLNFSFFIPQSGEKLASTSQTCEDSTREGK